MNRKRRTLLTIILTICMIVSMQNVALASAGIHTFEGDLEVIDSTTGKEIPNASISLVDVTNGSTVKYTKALNADGSFQITGIVPGDYGWVLTAGGYTPSEPNVTGMSELSSSMGQTKDLGTGTISLTEKGKEPGSAYTEFKAEQPKAEDSEIGPIRSLIDDFAQRVRQTYANIMGTDDADKTAKDEEETAKPTDASADKEPIEPIREISDDAEEDTSEIDEIDDVDTIEQIDEIESITSLRSLDRLPAIASLSSIEDIEKAEPKAEAAAEEPAAEPAAEPAMDVSISGGLYDGNGLSLSGHTVTLYKNGDRYETYQVSSTEGYEFTGLQAGTYVVEFSGNDAYSPAKTDAIVVTSETEDQTITGKDLYLSPKGTVIVSGTIGIKDSSNGYYPNGTVKVSLMKSDEEVMSTTCEADGSYLLKDIEPGAYTLVISGNGYIEKTTVMDLSAGASLSGQDFEIETAAALIKLELTRLPDQRVYEEGELLDTTGMIVMAHYADGIVKEIKDYDISGYGLELGENIVIVSYSEGGTTAETSFIVTVVEKEEPDPEDPDNPDNPGIPDDPGNSDDNNQGDNNSGNNNNGNNNGGSDGTSNTADGQDQNNNGGGTTNTGTNGVNGANGAGMGTDGTNGGAAGTDANGNAAAQDPNAQNENQNMDNAVQTSDESHVELLWVLVALCEATMLITLLTDKRGKRRKAIK